MTTSLDFNMLHLEAPRNLLQITEGTLPEEDTVEVANPTVWIRTLARQQKQAEEDLKRLLELCSDTIDRTDQRIQWVESAYHALADGTRYVYDRVSANEKIAEEWIRSELTAVASAYQTFATDIWQAIIE